jgi:TRAP-type C4-dicarboxylate transport system permease small subunit
MANGVHKGSSLKRVAKSVEWLCSAFAVAGGLVLCGIAMTTVVSVLGRKFFGGAVAGDFEIVEIGCAVAVSLFLPYCQLRKGNVIVDFFTLKASPVVQRWLDASGCVLLTLVAMLMTWRLGAGGISLYSSNDQTMVLQVGTWWAFLIVVPSMALLSAVGILTTIRALSDDSATPDRTATPETIS